MADVTPSLSARALSVFVTVVLVGVGGLSVAQAQSDSWTELEYSEAVDRRYLTHSGEPVGELLKSLGGRPEPPADERSEDRLRHNLYDPIAEQYAYLLPDLLDTIEPLPDPPMIEIAHLWDTGEAQPAWVELLRSRQLVVQSDGAGSMRVFLPFDGAPQTASADAARQTYAAHWSVLRHIFAAERRRLAGGKDELPTLRVRVHAYMHQRQLALFRLGLEAHTVTVEDTRPDGRRRPLDLAALRGFLASGLQLEGGRLDPDGNLRLVGSRVEQPPTVVGKPLDLSDLAVAYRAVFRGGLAEPYMSLERSFSPWTTVVNYGGRLRDTRLGMVSLLCDIRFKTFSIGLGIAEGRDMRPEVRELIPEFRSHLEHFAANPDASSLFSQQTRLWFAPDNVDLTLSADGDLLALRAVRMNAISERVADLALNPSGGEVPIWTRDTVRAINEHYEALATFFPEMTDLDQVVRLLSLFTWLREAAAEGLPVPELDALLALELPAFPTPRMYPRLLSFNALPQAGIRGVVHTFDQVAIGEAFERLDPTTLPYLPAARRLERAIAALDSRDPRNAALLEEIRDRNPATMDATALDWFAYRVERLRMHQSVLSTVTAAQRDTVIASLAPGDAPRVFSVGTGGLDLGMKPVLVRAKSRRLGLSSSALDLTPGLASRAAPRGAPVDARDEWRVDPAGLPTTQIPTHGLYGKALRRDLPGGWIDGARSSDGKLREVWTVLGAFSPELVSRKAILDGSGKARSFERVDRGRRLRYQFEQQSTRWTLRLTSDRALTAVASADTMTLPEGLVSLRVTAGSDPTRELGLVRLRLDASAGGVPVKLEADWPSATLQRLILGHAVDRTPNEPLGGLEPLPESLGSVKTLMLMQSRDQAAAPWESQARGLAGEENPVTLARAFDRWWRADGSAESAAGVVGVSETRSAERWKAAPAPGERALLLLPTDGFPGQGAISREELAAAWNAADVVAELPQQVSASMIVLVSRESPGMLARRLSELAARPAMKGKLLAVWSLGGSLRDDLPAELLSGKSVLAGLGLAESTVIGERTATQQLAAFQSALAKKGKRVEELGGPFLWFF